MIRQLENRIARIFFSKQYSTASSKSLNEKSVKNWSSSSIFKWDVDALLKDNLKKIEISNASGIKPMLPQKRMKPNLYSFSSGFFKISPRKVNLVTKTLIRMSVKDAMEQMQFSKKQVAFRIMALMHRSLANITHNYHGPGNETQSWFIKSMAVGRGKIEKGINYHARGRAGIRKTRHTTVQLILKYDPLRGNPDLLKLHLKQTEKHPLLQKVYNNQPMRQVLLRKLNQFQPKLYKENQRLGRVAVPWRKHQFKYITKPYWTKPVPASQ